MFVGGAKMDFSNKESNQQLADYLREQRQNQKLELEEVSTQIGVPIQHLKNIENGDFERFDSFYLKMYIKKYATYLSLNVGELYQQFYGNQIQQEVEVKIQKQQVEKRNQNIGRIAGIICGVLVVGLGIFYVVDMVKSATPKEDKNIVINNPESSTLIDSDKKEEVKSEDIQAPKEENNSQTEEPTPMEALDVKLVSQTDKEIVFDVLTSQDGADLKLEFTASCWLSATLGSQNLIPGETYQAAGGFEQRITKDQFGTLELNVGDATAIRILVDGQLLEFQPSTPHQYIKINLKTE